MVAVLEIVMPDLTDLIRAILLFGGLFLALFGGALWVTVLAHLWGVADLSRKAFCQGDLTLVVLSALGMIVGGIGMMALETALF